MKPVDAPLSLPEGARAVRTQAEPAGQDCVAVETPVALVYNGISHAVMLATPSDLDDFARGFSLTEGIVGRASDIRAIEVTPEGEGLRVDIEIASSCFAALKARRRSLAGRTGCGLCGAESLEQAVRPLAQLPEALPRVPAAAITRALHDLRARQPLHEVTGATHAAAFASLDGALRLVREDVGRHNALDKLAGALAHAGISGGDGFVVVTSRASYEMVAKTAALGAPLLAAVSGVTTLAIDWAERAGLCLVGFARGERHTPYTHAHRIDRDEIPHGR